MISIILFQINFLTLAVLSVFLCAGNKKNSERDVSLVQPGVQKVAAATSSGSGSKPTNDDFPVGVAPPHIPLAAKKSDERTLADIESIQSEKAVLRDKKLKAQMGGNKSKVLSSSHSPTSDGDRKSVV